MSDAQFGSLILLLFLFLASAHALGYVFTRLRQPRVVGEILAGLLLGPVVLGRVAPAMAASFQGAVDRTVLGFVYQLGLLLLMFASGAETRGLFRPTDRRQVAYLGLLGTLLPFVLALLTVPFLPLAAIAGPTAPRVSVLLVLSIAVAVTSIPVISKILHDLHILHTRFARLILGVAVLEDIGLWAVLAVAMALAKSGAVPQSEIARHVAATLAYFAAGLFLAPRLLRRLNRARWNFLAAASPVGYAVVVLFGYTALAAAFDISLVFAAFLAGFAVVTDPEHLGDAVASISKFSFGVFIPIYFAVVGYRLSFGGRLSLGLLVTFLAASCAVKFFSAGLGARAAGFDWLGSVNLAAALNARGGPGIVLASVAFDAGIINAAFYTVLVIAAVLTSQAAGAWLEWILKKGWPLLGWRNAELVESKGAAAREAA